MASGPKRAGKSYVGNMAWLLRQHRRWDNADFGLLTFSDSRREAILLECRDIAERAGIRWHRSNRYAEFGQGNRLWWWCGSHTMAHRQIEGHTWRGGLVDEAVRCHRNSITEMSSRCTPVGGNPAWPSTILYTTNPEGPTHPFKLNVIDPVLREERAGKYLEFSVDDNPAIPASEKEEMLLTFPEGVQRDRGYYGRWVSAGGAVYPNIRQWTKPAPKHSTETAMAYYVSVDPAIQSVTHALLIAEYHGSRFHVVDEWRYDGRVDGALQRGEQAQRVADWALQQVDKRISVWLVDPADPAWRHSLERYVTSTGVTGSRFPEFKKPNLTASIGAVNSAGENKVLRIAPKCGALIDEMSSLAWDEQKLEDTGEEKPTDGNDHGADALRYAVWFLEMHKVGVWDIPL